MKAAFERALNFARDGYLAAVDWIDDHPHAAAWIIVALAASHLVF